MPEKSVSGLTYADCGVSIEAQDEAIAGFKSRVEATFSGARGQVLAGIGSFGAAFQPDLSGIAQPLLVSSTDGVGTKVRLHARFGTHDWAGRDLAAAVVNDVLCLGARPLFFLDYIACNRVEPPVIDALVGGMADVLGPAGCALIGGEIAEMGDVYQSGEYDLAGFCVGLADRANALGPQRVADGSQLVGVASSGVHCNGFSLVRRLFESWPDERWLEPLEPLGCSLRDALLQPTVCYAAALEALRDGLPPGHLQALAHISGGGLVENLPRILPAGLAAQVERAAFDELAAQAGVKPLFDIIRAQAEIDDHEFYRVLNGGTGFVAVVNPQSAAAAAGLLQEAGFKALRLGSLVPIAARGRFDWV